LNTIEEMQMLNKVLCAAALAMVALPIAAQEVYVIDPRHSHPQWEIRHMGLTPQRGSFLKSTGKIELDRAAKKAIVDVTIDATSVRSWDNSLDAILKAERFFNTEKFPTITFKSTNVAFEGDRPSVIDGELTMLGVTKPVSLKVVAFNCGENPGNKKQMCGAEATTTIKRTEWGMASNLSSGSDEVKLTFPVEAYKDTL